VFSVLCSPHSQILSRDHFLSLCPFISTVTSYYAVMLSCFFSSFSSGASYNWVETIWRFSQCLCLGKSRNISILRLLIQSMTSLRQLKVLVLLNVTFYFIPAIFRKIMLYRSLSQWYVCILWMAKMVSRLEEDFKNC